MLHPDAHVAASLRAVLTLTRDQALGRSAIERALLAIPKPYAFVELDDECALVIGLFRRAEELGKADAAVLTFKHGLLWRCEYHQTIDAFRAGLPAESDHWLNPDRQDASPLSA